ncbi:glycosyltransferase [Chryseobacterium potabilaquae]|uniref:Putative glycosyltransferase n=1 Tax=Chryseobacterium potabilaquae TaxID=2675057 RepID=A0A6N4X0R3_9FLAO|nr:glycosyltransferase [Chryseobacterium potabilaquae]CAA7194358.1 putative glycosyltransferase [Chryseobacterium potabilaquae]
MESKKLSLILLSYYSEYRILKVYETVKKLLSQHNIPFEFIIIDDGSKDNSYKISLQLEQQETNVKAFQLSKNYTSHYSIFAGLSLSTGACALPIVDDEQQPYETIIDMYNLWLNGEKIIIPHRITREDHWKSKIFSETYYKIMNRLTEVQFPTGGADLFFIDREIIDILNTRIHPRNTSTVVEILRLGFNPYFYGYSRPIGINGKSRWTAKKKWRLAKDTFFSSSSFPIKFIFNLGLWVSLISFLLILFYSYLKISNSDLLGDMLPRGWTSIILFISFFGGLILFSLGVIAEYIWRIFEEVKDRPTYIIKDK